ncbi:MAG: hypothetical protein MSS69_00720 [Spirochaetales bacterium]|nr:hypothetical protein [Spirochaetales bacterium]
MNIYKRWMMIICFLSLSFLSKDMMLYSQKISDNSVQVALDLEDEINARYSFGFSSNEIKSLDDEVEDITSRGVELSVSEDKKEVTLGDQKVYIWWKVLSSKPFVMKISISSLKRIEPVISGGVGEFPVSISYISKDGSEKTITSETVFEEGVVYERTDTTVYGDCDSIPLDIFAKGIEDVVPGDYSGTVKLNLFIGE